MADCIDEEADSTKRTTRAKGALRREPRDVGANAYGALSQTRSIIAAQGWSRAPPQCGSEAATV